MIFISRPLLRDSGGEAETRRRLKKQKLLKVASAVGKLRPPTPIARGLPRGR